MEPHLQGRIGAIPLITAIRTLPTVTVIRIMVPITPAITTGAFEQLTGDIPDIGAFVGLVWEEHRAAHPDGYGPSWHTARAPSPAR